MERAWYKEKITDILEALSSNESGLDKEEVSRRLQEYGPNKLPEAKVDCLFVIFLRQFQSPLIYILFGASLIVFVMREIVDGSIILFVLLFNAVVGTIQEGKAQNTLSALKKFVQTNALVVRNEKEFIVPDTEVVPGDIILLQEGEKVPADARIVISRNIKVDEAALTGESGPVYKTADVLEKNDLSTADQKNMVFKGTNIVAGNGKAVVVATGPETVIGKISKVIAAIDTEIPLRANVRYLSRLILFAVAGISAVLFLSGIAFGQSFTKMFTTVVALSVSIIPEGLPIVMTLVLATGVWRMAKRNALVKKLHAVEALGQARVIAVDKTGTITKNEMMVEKVFIDDKTFEVKGVGYEPKGDIVFEGNIVDPLNHPELLFTGKIAAFCANARTVFSKENNQWLVFGDPTEAAFAVFAEKIGFRKDDLESESPKLDEIPFDYKTRYHATVHNAQGEKFLTVVGAPESILSLTTKIWHGGRTYPLEEKRREEIESIFGAMSRSGLRVVALAVSHEAPEALSPLAIKELTFAGFFGLKDTLRPEVREALEKTTSAGIRVLMITGDHKLTAEAVAREAGIYRKGDEVLTGKEIEEMSEDELVLKLDKISVFARVTPEHKLKIIKAYKKRKQIIAMTGDGVNDAPSLVAADLGVAMGKIGTEVAKEAADIVLLDDNFGSIVSAVEEGRSIYKTIKKAILYLFSTSIGEVLAIGGALFVGYPLPVLPAQIIWLNLVTDGFLTVALAMEPKEEGLLRGNFERPKKYLVDSLMAKRMFLMAIPMMVGTLFLFRDHFGIDLTKAWTISLTTLAVFQWFNAWNCRHESKSILGMNPFSNKFLVAATIAVFFLQLLAIYNPLMQKLLRTTALDLSDWLIIIPVALSIVLVEEARKFFHRKWSK